MSATEEESIRNLVQEIDQVDDPINRIVPITPRVNPDQHKKFKKALKPQSKTKDQKHFWAFRAEQKIIGASGRPK